MTKLVVIENPVLNSPFFEPGQHFRFGKDGITNEIVEGRRPSSYFIPIAQPKKKGKQLTFDTEWTEERIRENEFINQVRQQVGLWRLRGHWGVTRTTQRLLEYWTRQDRDRKLFFCQIEALETAIYIAEVARKHGDNWIENDLRRFGDEANPPLLRIAHKMATGTGKTIVMAMLIAWQTLNKAAEPQDARFTDTFLVVTPGITIRDRLRVLLPNDPHNYYSERDVVPDELRGDLQRARIVITNFHAFLRRDRSGAGKLHRSLLGQNDESALGESPESMVRRVCREFGNKRNIIVLNDEAHHCYRRRPDAPEPLLRGEERAEAERRNEEARVWISGLEAVKNKIGVRVVYDLSATPFFLRGSGYPEGTLFPWVVSDFSLIDAIECGIVKVPRVPVADDSGANDQPTYRDLWLRIREHLPRTGRRAGGAEGEPRLPAELQGALHSLYDNYERYFREWERSDAARNGHGVPPVFIVVCSNTNVSKLVHDYIAGWEKPLPNGNRVIVAGQLPLFSNELGGQWTDRPRTILIDSEQLESGEALSPEFKRMASGQIEEFKTEYRTRFPGRDVDELTDENILREVMNTVGRPGKLGESIRCVVSVSMLTEGWDASSVTHILGVRAFGTQLLCEQVVGRGLRRMSYTNFDAAGRLVPEYAEVYGVPFSFIPCSGSNPNPQPGPQPTRVRALENRIASEITFPRLIGYRYDIPARALQASFSADAHLTLSTAIIPTWTENAPIVGASNILTLDDLKGRRVQEVVFLLAKLVLEKYYRQDGRVRTDRLPEHRFDAEVQAPLFPQVLRIAREWLDTCVTCKDSTFPQMLLLIEFAHDAADRIYRSIVTGSSGEKTLKPMLRPYDPVGSTRYVDFDTTRKTYATSPNKCHVSHVVADTSAWEQKMAQVLETMGEVVAYVKNHGLGFVIPYTIGGEERSYLPDFLARVDDGHGPGDLLNLIVEVSGEPRRDKAAKVSTVRQLWVPAVNNHGAFGRWGFVEVTDPWDAANIIRASLEPWAAGRKGD